MRVSSYQGEIRCVESRAAVTCHPQKTWEENTKEDRGGSIFMRKFSFLIALAMLAGTLVLSSTTANAQDDKQAAQADFERNWYDICYTKKDNEKCYQLSKELIDKYPTSQYKENATKNVKNWELNKAWEKFNASLKAFYNPPPDAAKLEALFTSGDEFLRVEPDQQNPFHLFALGQTALAGRIAVLGQSYKNLDKVKGYAERALKLYETATPPEKFKKEYADYVTPLKDLVLANLNQFLGYYLIETKGDQEQAINYLTKATQVKSKDGAGWKDPNNYWLRASIYSKQYEELRKKYDALPDEQKTGDSGKELLKQVNQLLDEKLIPDYARTNATANNPESKGLKDASTELFNAFWKFRVDDPTKAPAFIKAFEADPTITSPPVPAKAETADMTAPAAPVTSGTSPKLGTGSTTMTPGASSAKSANNGAKSNGKAAPAKGKSKRRKN
jgi:hypothetical protein